MFLSTKTQNTHQMSSGLLVKTSKLRGVIAPFSQLNLLNKITWWWDLKGLENVSLDRSRKTLNFKTIDEKDCSTVLGH